jgi:hypothetical protein
MQGEDLRASFSAQALRALVALLNKAKDSVGIFE